MSKARVPKKSQLPINRDVGAQSKGPRLQRLRAAQLLIKSLDSYPKRNEYVAVECQGDVFSSVAENGDAAEYHEENKDYADSVAFTISSHEVANTLVAFVDCWISKCTSNNVRFGFYTPNNYGKEKRNSRTQSFGIDWPENPVLSYLSEHDFDADKVLESTRLAIISEYKRQASVHANVDGDIGTVGLKNANLIEKWTLADWKRFLEQIEWKFGADDADEIKTSLVDAIQRCSEFSERLVGKEEIIINSLVDLIDQRQSNSDVTQRFVHVSEILLIFRTVDAGIVRLPDPAWRLWESLGVTTDSRNLSEKISAVCPSVSDKVRKRWERRAAQSMIEQRALLAEKSVLALKYQVYDACEEKLDTLCDGLEITEAELLQDMEELIRVALKKSKDCQQQYAYRLRSDSSVETMVFELFDSCFLSFDGARSNG